MAELEKLLCTDSKVESLKKINAIIENGGGTGLQMFDTILKDHILTYEESKGLALQGTYVYKEAIAGSRYGYPDFYNKVVEEFNEATNTETINGVTVKIHSNGHKFYDIADKDSIDNFFNTMGTAWFYGVDTENERIFLPRSNYLTSYVANGDKTVRVYGTGKALGLTDGSTTYKGLFGYGINSQAAVCYATGAYNADVGTKCSTMGWNSGQPALGVVQNSTTSGLTGKVNIQNTQNGMYLYICVGNTTNYEGVTDVVNQGMEILEQVAQKVNVDGTNLNAEGKSLFTSLAFPAKFENLTLGASDSTYTAPANGWVHYLAEATGAGSSVSITSCGINEFSTASTVGYYHSVTVPVLKGSSFYVGYNKATKIVFRFIYAEGDV